jgi:S-DNA-T family DNA segregation ATPase FtsK/SpoIIIE
MLDFFAALGITDLDTFDPRPRWKKNSHDSNFEVPIGFRSTESHERTNELVTLDFGEASVGGAGPHGAFQGVTGSGKSSTLNGIVLGLCTWFGPDKLNLILMDFKGGATFPGFEKLPHVVANITNLAAEVELVDRAYEAIGGEIIRRETYLQKYKAKDIVDYRKMRQADPDNYPPLPDLFIFVDEFHEFMTTHKEQGHLGLLTRVGAVGRGLGMHIIPCSQFIDTTLLQDLMWCLTFGISLRVQTGQRSRAVLKDTDAAKDLPSGKGAAILRRDTGERLTNFIGFDVEARYIESEQTPRQHTQHPTMRDALIQRLSEFA